MPFSKLLPLLLVAACASDDVDYEYVPFDPSTVAEFRFSMAAFSGNDFEYTFDNRTAKFSGYRIQREADNDATVCRELVAQPTAIDPTELRTLLAGNIAVLDDTECTRVLAREDEVIGDGDFMRIYLDGLHSSNECRDLVPQPGLQDKLHEILASLAPQIDEVRYAGNDGYVPVHSKRAPTAQCGLLLPERSRL